MYTEQVYTMVAELRIKVKEIFHNTDHSTNYISFVSN